MTTRRCPHCRWQGAVRLYRLATSTEWACPGCLHLVIDNAPDDEPVEASPPRRRRLRQLIPVA